MSDENIRSHFVQVKKIIFYFLLRTVRHDKEGNVAVFGRRVLLYRLGVRNKGATSCCCEFAAQRR